MSGCPEPTVGGLMTTIELPGSLLPQPGEQHPVLALTGSGDLLGYFETVDAARAAADGPVILYIAG